MNKTSNIFLGLILLAPCFAFGHPQDMGSLKVQSHESQLRFSLELSSSVAAAISGLKESALEDPRELRLRAPALIHATLTEAPLESSAGACTWKEAGAVLVDEKVRMSAFAECPKSPDAWTLKLPFISRAGRGFELLVKADVGGQAQEFVASANTGPVILKAGQVHPWSQFVTMGVRHIGAIPSEWTGAQGLRLPDGIDHILFVLALVLGGGGFIGILKTVTGFTIGHSITLALATLGVVQIPSRWVESAIALSIAVVAGESLFLKRAGDRWRIALAFGLIHGLGFASALAELHLDRSSLLKALVGFNVGVEMGQAIIVSIALPVLFLMQRPVTSRRFVIPTCASLIFVAGSYWFVRRAFAI